MAIGGSRRKTIILVIHAIRGEIEIAKIEPTWVDDLVDEVMDGRLVSFDVALGCHDRSPFCPSKGLISPRYDDGPNTPISTSPLKFRASMAKPQRTAIQTPAQKQLAGSEPTIVTADREYLAGPGKELSCFR